MVKQGRRKATNAQEAAIATVANGSNSDGRAVSADTGCTQAAAAQRGRHYTISMAVPGSMIDNTQNLEFATFVASQVARTAAIFSVDELVVVDDSMGRGDGAVSAGAAFLARVCQYLETPQYLRKALIPMHPDLRLGGLMPPLDAPHHMRASEWQPYREGVVLRAEPGVGCFVDVGLDRTAMAPEQAPVGARVTLALGPGPNVDFMAEFGENMIRGHIVSPSAPREEAGLYWGYNVRLADGLHDLIHGCPWHGGYDLRIGTSEHGQIVPPGSLALPRFQHVLIAFGGPEGLEAAISHDVRIAGKEPSELFDLYINTCPGQGSRTIRTEEAVLISMAYLQNALACFGSVQG